MEVFAKNKKQINIKRLLLITKKNRHLKLMILTLFCVCEDARIWVYGNYSLDVYLNYLGTVSCFPPS